MITCKTAWSICKGTVWWLSTLLTQSPSPDPGPLCIESHPCLQPQCLEWRQLQKPHRGPDMAQTREAGHLFEELQLGGVLQELPHGS